MINGYMKKVMLFALFLYLCAGSSAAMAQLDVSEGILDFGVLVRPKTKSITVSVVNKSSSPYLGSVAIEKPWLKASPRDFSLASGKKQDVVFTMETVGLDPGDYETLIYFRDLMGNSKAEISGKCIVMEGKDDPVLKVNGNEVNYKQVVRGEHPHIEIWVENVGSGVLQGNVHYPEWIKAEEKVELHYTQKRPYFMMAVTADMAPGNYTGEVRFETNGGNRALPVFMKLVGKDDDPILSFEPSSVDFGVVRKGKKGRIKVKILNKGKGRLSGTITYPEWIEADEEFKEIEKNKEIMLVANVSKLPPGTTRDVIKLTSKLGMLDIPVKITVEEGKGKKKGR